LVIVLNLAAAAHMNVKDLENNTRDGQAGKFVRKDRKKDINSRDELQKGRKERAKKKKQKLEQTKW
jgi:hypothetical protein